MRLSKRNLWIKVSFLLAAFSLSVALLSGYFSSLIVKSSWEREIRKSYSRFLQFIAKDILGMVQRYREILEFAAEVIESTPDEDNWEIETFLVSICLRFPSFEWVRYISEEGKILASSEMFSSSDRELFLGVLGIKRPISDVLYDSQGEPYLTVTVPCQEGYICGRINLSSIWDDIKDLIFTPDWKIFVVDSHGKTVFCTDYQLLFQSKKIPMQSMVTFKEKIPQLNWSIILGVESPDFYRDIFWVSLWLWGIVFALSLLAFWLSVRVSRSWFKSLERIVPFIQEISRGNLDVYLDIKRDDEIGLLVSQVNKMVANLKELRRQSNIQAVGEAISWLGHEIKNYFVPIKAFIDSLPERHKEGEYIRKMSKLVGREIEKCEKMLQDLMALRPDFSMELGDVGLYDLVSSVIEMLRPLLQAKAIQVCVRVPSDLYCRGDQERLKTAILNLLLNSVEVLSPGGVISISAWMGGDWINLEIRDTGPGIPEDIVDRIFEPFVSSKNFPNGRELMKNKRGLGLAIVYNIIKRHGGNISFTTGSSGTTFLLSLPVAKR